MRRCPRDRAERTIRSLVPALAAVLVMWQEGTKQNATRRQDRDKVRACQQCELWQPAGVGCPLRGANYSRVPPIQVILAMGLDSKTSFASGGLAQSESRDVGSEAGRSPGLSDDEGADGDVESPVDNSPHAEVCASVPAVDKTALSISPSRTWTLLLLFSLRYPSVATTSIIVLVLVHPLGRLRDLALE
jgi:hypothetical protein